MSMKERDVCLDFLRGVAAVSVVFIHTVFWSGGSYVPEIFRTLALLLDVPFFIFLSGWAASFSSRPHRIFDNLLKIWARWAVFVLLADGFSSLFWKDSLTPLAVLNQLFFNVGESIPHLPVINGSLWFMPMYVVVSILGMAFIFLSRRFNLGGKIAARFVIFLLVGLSYLSLGWAGQWFSLSRQVCFYLPLFIIGYHAKKIKVTFPKYIVSIFALVAFWFILSRTYGIPAKNLQNAKFPPHIMYFSASLLSVITAIFLRDALDWQKMTIQEYANTGGVRFVCLIGENALCFYFAQGVGSSLIFLLVPLAKNYGWKVILALSFVTNLAITLTIGFSLVFIFRILRICLAHLKERFCRECV